VRLLILSSSTGGGHDARAGALSDWARRHPELGVEVETFSPLEASGPHYRFGLHVYHLVQVNWPSVANGDPNTTAWDTHATNFGPLKNLHCPKLDSAVSSLLEDLDQRGMLEDTLVLAIGEFGRSPRMGISTSGNSNAPDGRDHWPYCYTGLIAGAGVKGGQVYGKSDATGSTPLENPVHPTDILATVYHTLGIDPHTIVYNHLDQPRELVKGEPIAGIF